METYAVFPGEKVAFLSENFDVFFKPAYDPAHRLSEILIRRKVDLPVDRLKDQGLSMKGKRVNAGAKRGKNAFQPSVILDGKIAGSIFFLSHSKPLKRESFLLAFGGGRGRGRGRIGLELSVLEGLVAEVEVIGEEAGDVLLEFGGVRLHQLANSFSGGLLLFRPSVGKGETIVVEDVLGHDDALLFIVISAEEGETGLRLGIVIDELASELDLLAVLVVESDAGLGIAGKDLGSIGDGPIGREKPIGEELAHHVDPLPEILAVVDDKTEMLRIRCDGEEILSREGKADTCDEENLGTEVEIAVDLDHRDVSSDGRTKLDFDTAVFKTALENDLIFAVFLDGRRDKLECRLDLSVVMSGQPCRLLDISFLIDVPILVDMENAEDKVRHIRAQAIDILSAVFLVLDVDKGQLGRTDEMMFGDTFVGDLLNLGHQFVVIHISFSFEYYLSYKSYHFFPNFTRIFHKSLSNL